MILILTGINLLTYFKGNYALFQSDFKWESITAGGGCWGVRLWEGNPDGKGDPDVAREA